ncbi:MAG TPA: hypothetical protein VL738_13685 [Dactylosporangium sp.]|nr:hypothetical protein [Dactylosporangium sp.]
MSIKAIRRVGLAAAGVVTAGVFVFGAASLASAETAAPSPSASSGAGSHKNDGGHGAGTAVTGEELAKVSAAVKAKDSAVTVDKAWKGPDGAYHVLGTKNDAKVFFNVSADLKTVSQGTGKPGGHEKGTAVTGEDLAKVTAAVKAKDPAVTVDKAWKDPDGAYHVLGTKNDAKVIFKVSGDLKTVTQDTHGPRK